MGNQLMGRDTYEGTYYVTTDEIARLSQWAISNTIQQDRGSSERANQEKIIGRTYLVLIEKTNQTYPNKRPDECPKVVFKIDERFFINDIACHKHSSFKSSFQRSKNQ